MDAWQGGWRKEEREHMREPARSKLARLAATRDFFFLAISAK
jgi:hypothetical protein